MLSCLKPQEKINESEFLNEKGWHLHGTAQLDKILKRFFGFFFDIQKLQIYQLEIEASWAK